MLDWLENEDICRVWVSAPAYLCVISRWCRRQEALLWGETESSDAVSSVSVSFSIGNAERENYEHAYRSGGSA